MYLGAENPNPYAVLPALAGAPAGCGLGCTDCGGRCGGGLGLFESGLDYSEWGWKEYAAVALGAYVLTSVFFTTNRAVSSVRRLPGERRKRLARAYRDKADEIAGKGKKRKLRDF